MAAVITIYRAVQSAPLNKDVTITGQLMDTPTCRLPNCGLVDSRTRQVKHRKINICEQIHTVE